MLTRKERYLAIATGAIVLVLAVDQFVAKPYLATKTELDDQYHQLCQEKQLARNLLTAEASIDKRWRDMGSASFVRNTSEADSLFSKVLGDWKTKAGLIVEDQSTGNEKAVGKFNETGFKVLLRGSMKSLNIFLQQMEASSIPIRIQKLTFSRESKTQGDVRLDVRFSLLWGGSNHLDDSPAPKHVLPEKTVNLPKYAIIHKRNIFDPNRAVRVANTDPVAVPDPPNPAEYLVLRGILGSGENLFAMIEDSRDGTTQNVSVGMEIGYGHLEKISPGQVVYRSESESITVLVGHYLNGNEAGIASVSPQPVEDPIDTGEVNEDNPSGTKSNDYLKDLFGIKKKDK